MAVVFVAFAIAMAGCSGPGAANNKSDNDTPDAKLETSKNIGFTGESFTFDGSKSEDSDGEIVEWRFDFGDGAKFVATTEDQAKPTHSYAEGGEYTATLTVLDDGKDNAGAESDMTTRTVAVNMRQEVPPATVFANPAGGDNETVGVGRTMFDVKDEADRIEVTVDARSAVLAGESRIEVRVLNDEDDEIAREERTIGAQSNETFELNDMALNNDPGTYTLEIIAHSGGATYDGDIEVYYDAGYTN
jgi:PKD repeat protein